MSLESALAAFGGADTPIPLGVSAGVSEKFNKNNGDTPDTPDTPKKEDTRDGTGAELLYATAEHLAEDRRTCSQCRNLAHNGFCMAARRGEVHRPTRTWYEPIPDILHRCGAYSPNADDEDQRPGFERWPFLIEPKKGGA